MKFNSETICAIMIIASIFSCSEKPSGNNSSGPEKNYMKKFSNEDKKKIKSIASNNPDNEEKLAKVICKIVEKFKELPDYKTMPAEMKKKIEDKSEFIKQLNDKENAKMKDGIMSNLDKEVTVKNGSVFLGNFRLNGDINIGNDNEQLLSLANNDPELAKQIDKHISSLIENIKNAYKSCSKKDIAQTKIKEKSKWFTYLNDPKNKTFKESFMTAIKNHKTISYSIEEVKIDNLILPKDLYL